MNVFLLTDLEGIAGVDDIGYMDRAGEKYAKARGYLTETINLAAESCFDSGAEGGFDGGGLGFGLGLRRRRGRLERRRGFPRDRRFGRGAGPSAQTGRAPRLASMMPTRTEGFASPALG